MLVAQFPFSHMLQCWMRRCLYCIGLCLPLSLAVQAIADTVSDPVPVRAVWLERFTRYIDWPEGSRVNDATQPFTLCIWRDTQFAQLAQSLYLQQKIKDKTPHIVDVQKTEDLRDCDLLFIPNVAGIDVQQLLAPIAQHPVLLITFNPAGADRGVHINMYDEQGYQRFEIDVDAMKRSGLIVRSRLLQVARVIHGGGVP